MRPTILLVYETTGRGITMLAVYTTTLWDVGFFQNLGKGLLVMVAIAIVLVIAFFFMRKVGWMPKAALVRLGKEIDELAPTNTKEE